MMLVLMSKPSDSGAHDCRQAGAHQAVRQPQSQGCVAAVAHNSRKLLKPACHVCRQAGAHHAVRGELCGRATTRWTGPGSPGGPLPAPPGRAVAGDSFFRVLCQSSKASPRICCIYTRPGRMSNAAVAVCACQAGDTDNPAPYTSAELVPAPCSARTSGRRWKETPQSACGSSLPSHGGNPHKHRVQGLLTKEGWIACVYHGWKFDGNSGKCMDIPQQQPGDLRVHSCWRYEKHHTRSWCEHTLLKHSRTPTLIDSRSFLCQVVYWTSVHHCALPAGLLQMQSSVSGALR